MNINNICDNYESNFISIHKFNDKIFNVKYKKERFIIEPKISFSNCKIYNKNNKYSMKIELDIKNVKHIQFKKFINNIYNEISTCIELDDNINNVFNINNPLKTNLSNIYCLYVTINKSSTFINYENNEQIGIDNLHNKSFIGYPIFYSPNININNENVYINFSLYKIYVKINDISNTDIFYEADKLNIEKAMKDYI